MKVLLLKDTPNVGKKNEVKEVNDGFARNFLLARKLAILATHSALRSVEKEKMDKQQRRLADQKRYQDIADRIKTLNIVITTKIGQKGKAFGSVGTHIIKKALDKEGISIEEEWIALEDPLKNTGTLQIPLKFPHGVFGSVSVTIKSE